MNVATNPDAHYTIHQTGLNIISRKILFFHIILLEKRDYYTTVSRHTKSDMFNLRPQNSDVCDCCCIVCGNHFALASNDCILMSYSQFE